MKLIAITINEKKSSILAIQKIDEIQDILKACKLKRLNVKVFSVGEYNPYTMKLLDYDKPKEIDTSKMAQTIDKKLEILSKYKTKKLIKELTK